MHCWAVATSPATGLPVAVVVAAAVAAAVVAAAVAFLEALQFAATSSESSGLAASEAEDHES